MQTRHRSRGFTMAELLVFVAILGVVAATAMAGWQTYRRTAEVTGAARQFKSAVYKARMLSVYRGEIHFVVLHPGTKRLEIYRDSSAPFGQFDTGDARVSGESLPAGANLALPKKPSPLSNPLGGTSLTDAWSLPKPNPSGAWGAERRGVVTTPTGLIRTAEATPQTVNNGVVVFSDQFDRTASVGLRGQSGSAKSFRLVESNWEKL